MTNTILTHSVGQIQWTAHSRKRFADSFALIEMSLHSGPCSIIPRALCATLSLPPKLLCMQLEGDKAPVSQEDPS